MSEKTKKEEGGGSFTLGEVFFDLVLLGARPRFTTPRNELSEMKPPPPSSSFRVSTSELGDEGKGKKETPPRQWVSGIAQRAYRKFSVTLRIDMRVHWVANFDWIFWAL